ncbi:beta-mannosidase-like isoform X1 [Centruroides sculpturatus]|uniref:beta-mannosidase-like isoform X1 n=1 Tax=Centruroides sculpturatus TaxID=218467 RepID=UPI000C6DA268|nr:beta-mannosidase-like isoform X1 [Centruroides sculpturatus]
MASINLWTVCAYLISIVILTTAKYSPFITLDGEWKVRNGNGSIIIPAKVPGGIFTDLKRQGIIDDPYFRFNDEFYRWIGKDSWEYYRRFDLNKEILSKNSIFLVAHGLDTIADIYINNRYIGRSTNMFVRYKFNLKLNSLLKESNNSIRISFISPVEYSKTRSNEYMKKYRYVVPPICPPPVQNGECHVNFIRKVQSSFSWDWGPSFPTMGIWKNIGIEAYDTVIIRDITVATIPKKSDDKIISWKLNLTVYFENANMSTSTNVTIKLNKLILITKIFLLNNRGVLNITVNIPTNYSIELWYPNGYGKQKLYNLTVTFDPLSSLEIASKTICIGFRFVELIQEKIKGSSGLSFYFKINDVPIFAKGSNWIPADSFPDRITEEYIRHLLQSVKDANMNMLRVWGGGMYEQDSFYKIADELGILIWQDLMFAVALYPVNKEFLDSVSIEVKQQIQRLQHHPSIVLWAGNNENEVGIAQKWWPSVYLSYERYKKDYITLYIKTIAPIVTEDNTRPFLPSSPSNGKITEKDGWISSNPQDTHYGDVHFYDYTSDSWDWKIYPRARFVSEYGFQSYPSFITFSNVSLPKDWTYPFGKFVSHRQHHLFGGLEMLKSILNHLFLPKIKCGPQAFKDLLYLSQIAQAMSIKTETEFYRRSQSDIINGEGKTMGALYWQLNDIWQAPTWSSIEYGGRWKMLHYFAVNFFSDFLVSPYKNGTNITVSFISDKTQKFDNLTLYLNIYHWSSFNSIYKKNLTFNQLPQSSQTIFTVLQTRLLNAAGCKSSKECFLTVSVKNKDGHQLGPNNYLFLSSFKQASGIKKANISIENIEIINNTTVENQEFKITLSSDNIAPFVWLETKIKGRFSTNGFLLISSKFDIIFFSKERITTFQLQKKLNIRSLLDVCN